MNPYADDLATLGETLDQDNAIHVGHSTGGGEVAGYIRRHGETRCQGPDPHCRPRRLLTVLRGSRCAVLRRQQARHQDFARLAGFYLVSGNAGRTQRRLRLHQGFSDTDFTEDLKKFAVQPSFCTAKTTRSVSIGASALSRPRSLRGGGRLALSSRRVFLDG
jgi:pimeloyl-ACP methyl ester carboxylesterase